MYICKDDKVKTRTALGQTTLDFVEKLDAVENPAIVCDTYQEFIENLGFLNSACLHLPEQGEHIVDCVLMNTRPEEWTREYVERDYFRYDPMARELTQSYIPFAWSEVLSSRKLSPTETDIMSLTADYGMNDGFVIPIFEANGRIALVSLAGQDIEFGPSTRSAIILASIYLHNRLRTLKHMKVDNRIKLTPREVECLHWVASGKSDWQIGQILNISAKTVNYHVENVKRKFGVATRIQAVIAAIRQSQLQV